MSQIEKNLIRAGGAIVSFVVLSSVALAQTSTTNGTTTPGVPTTAVGGEWLSNIVFVLLGILFVYLGLREYNKSNS